MRCTFCKKRIDLDGLSPSWHSVQDAPELPGEVMELVDPAWREELVQGSTRRPYCRPGGPSGLSECFLNWMQELKEDSRGEAYGEDFEKGEVL